MTNWKKKLTECDRSDQIRKVYFLVGLDGDLFDLFERIAPTAKDQRELIKKFVEGLVDRVLEVQQGVETNEKNI